MTSRLSSDRLDELAPLLSSVARLVASRAKVDQNVLGALLMGVDAESDPAALRELERWQKLLDVLRGNPSPAMRQATVEGLRLRGLPEAAVLLAVDDVVGSVIEMASQPSQGKSGLSASVGDLDLGRLPPGQAAQAEFEVWGGPGHIIVDSDQAQVSPDRFDEGHTRVRVDVKAAAGGRLCTTLKLITEAESLPLPLTIAWEESPADAPNAGRQITVELDGSGDHTSLAEAFRQTQAGDTIIMGTGQHRLEEPLVVDKPVVLVGEGMHRTQLIGAGDGHVVWFCAEGTSSASDLAFVYEGKSAGDCVKADRGKLWLDSCRFVGAACDSSLRDGGCGLRLFGTVRGCAHACEMEGHDRNGISVEGHAQIDLEHNTCQRNTRSGIAFRGSARGTARANTCAENVKYGIYVGQEAQPTLENNTCQRNKSCGIAFVGSARGTARANTCAENEDGGIYVGQEAQPTLENNTCTENGKAGIYVGQEAQPTLENNTCTKNLKYGIYVRTEAQPTLEDNSCQRNKCSGIAFSGSGRGTARANTCAENEEHGIYVDEQAQPTLEDNSCQRNKWSGIAFWASARGTARANTCTENGTDGIYVGEEAQPTLENNTSQRNKQSGIGFFGSARGTAHANTCTQNEKHGICVGQQAQPTLESNTCQRNKQGGIMFFGSARGIARANTCTENEIHGIYVGQEAQPTLESNTCRQNKADGISYREMAGGRAVNNECAANGENGIFVPAGASPVIKDNRCRGNKGRDIRDRR